MISIGCIFRWHSRTFADDVQNDLLSGPSDVKPPCSTWPLAFGLAAFLLAPAHALLGLAKITGFSRNPKTLHLASL